MTTHHINRCDVVVGQHTVEAYVGSTLVLSKFRNRPWTVGDDASLGDIAIAVVALMDFYDGRDAA